MRNIINLFGVICFFMVVLASCRPAKDNHTGREYMPDMGHSIAYEANHFVYYDNNTWESKDSLLSYYTNPLLPVKGTIPRGYTGVSLAEEAGSEMEDKVAMLAGMPKNGHVPYYYEDTEEERTRATNEILENPFPITAEAISEGKELYNIFCATCHGEKADGNGYLVRDEALGGKYPAQPANMLSEEFIAASEGRYYHALVYGKNVMGGYTDKLSYEERWNVIHYIRSLQAKETGVAYLVEADANNAEDNAGLAEADKPEGE